MRVLYGRRAKMLENLPRLSTHQFVRMIVVGNARKFVMKRVDGWRSEKWFLNFEF
jgi:hypothetical protein